MSQTAYSIIDADGHVTESLEQVSKYLDAPYNRRPHTFPFYPVGRLGPAHARHAGRQRGTAEQWLRALDLGGMEQAVLYPTLGLFLSFLKDREWAVALCRAYNTFLHEEFVKQTPRLHAVALLPVQDPDAAARELRRAVTELGLVGAMLAADGSHLLGDSRYLPHLRGGRPPRRDAGRARLRLAPGRRRPRASSRASSRPTPARTPSARCGRSPR